MQKYPRVIDIRLWYFRIKLVILRHKTKQNY
jgi:hypothetical protein